MTGEQRAHLDELMFQLVARTGTNTGKGWFYFINSDTVHDEGREIDWVCRLCNREVINSNEFEYPDPMPDVVDDQIDQHALAHLKDYNLLAFL